MKVKRFKNNFFVRIDKGEEIVQSLKECCKKYGISLGTVKGIGATNKVSIGFFNPESKEYFSKEMIGNFEIALLYGNISTINNEIYLHLHINLGDRNYNSYSGHLNSAIVSATFEAVISAIDGKCDRRFDPETGLNILDI